MGLMFLLIVLLIVAVIAVFVTYAQVKDEWGIVVFVAALFVVIIACVGVVGYLRDYRDEHVATCHVNSKDRGGEDGAYRVYTSDCGVLGNGDSWLRAKFDSADIWNEIPNSGEVRLRLVGTRFPMLSWFPNVLEVLPAEESAASSR